MSAAVEVQIRAKCGCQSFEGCADFDAFHYKLQLLRYRLFPVIGHDNFELVLDSRAKKLTVIIHDGDEIDRCVVDLP